MLLAYSAIVLLVLVTVYSAFVSFRQRPEGEIAPPNWIFPNGAKRSALIFVGLATLIFAIGLGAWFKISVSSSETRNSSPRSWRFLVPEGYGGWVRVEFEIPGAPPLPTEGGQIVLKIPPSGLLRTSSPEEYGWAKDDYVFYSTTGVRSIPDAGPGRLIWGKINGEETGSSGNRKYEEFFVGTEPQYKHQMEQAKPKDFPQNSHSPAAIP